MIKMSMIKVKENMEQLRNSTSMFPEILWICSGTATYGKNNNKIHSQTLKDLEQHVE